MTTYEFNSITTYFIFFSGYDYDRILFCVRLLLVFMQAGFSA